MRLLLDECLPRRTKFLFAESGHECETVRDAGFSGKENGELIALAEKKFNVLRRRGHAQTELSFIGRRVIPRTCHRAPMIIWAFAGTADGSNYPV